MFYLQCTIIPTLHRYHSCCYFTGGRTAALIAVIPWYTYPLNEHLNSSYWYTVSLDLSQHDCKAANALSSTNFPVFWVPTFFGNTRKSPKPCPNFFYREIALKIIGDNTSRYGASERLQPSFQHRLWPRLSETDEWQTWRLRRLTWSMSSQAWCRSGKPWKIAFRQLFFQLGYSYTRLHCLLLFVGGLLNQILFHLLD